MGHHARPLSGARSADSSLIHELPRSVLRELGALFAAWSTLGRRRGRRSASSCSRRVGGDLATSTGTFARLTTSADTGWENWRESQLRRCEPTTTTSTPCSSAAARSASAGSPTSPISSASSRPARSAACRAWRSAMSCAEISGRSSPPAGATRSVPYGHTAPHAVGDPAAGQLERGSTGGSGCSNTLVANYTASLPNRRRASAAASTDSSVSSTAINTLIMWERVSRFDDVQP
jgi:hypothetical protein